MSPKTITIYYVVSIFMMANDAFFTWVGMQTHLSFWRQLITVIGLYIVFKTLRQYNGLHYIKSIYRSYGTIFKIIAFLSIITIIVNGYSLDRVLYSVWGYAFGLPYLLFPFYAKQCGWTDHKFNMLFIYLGSFLSVGILLDYISGGFFTSAFLLAVTQREGDFEAGRFCFLSTAPTIFTVYYCFCLFCLMKEAIDNSGTMKKFLLLSLSLLFIFGSVFCGSRQTLAGLLIVEALGLYNIFKASKSSIFVMGVTFVVAYMFMPQAQEMLSGNQGFQDRYSVDVLREDERQKTWEEGWNDCIFHPTIRRALIGDGVGRVKGYGAASNDVGNHYENSFFARINEVGWIVSFWMLLLPVLFMIRHRDNRVKSSLMYYGIIAAFLFISMISPNGGSNTTQMALFIALGKFIEDNKLESYEH